MFTAASLLVVFTVHVCFLHQSLAANCKAESDNFYSCLNELNNGILAKAGKPVNANQDGKYQEAATACFTENGCPLDNSPLASHNTDKISSCEAQAAANYKAGIESCVHSNGDPQFSLAEKSSKKKATDHTAFENKVHRGFKSCSENGVAPSVISKCLQSKLPALTTAATNRGSGSGSAFGSIDSLADVFNAGNLQALVNPFKDLCDAKSKCYDKISDDCTTSVCECFSNNTELDTKISADLKTCFASEVNFPEEKLAALALQVKGSLQPGFCTAENNKDPCAADSVLSLFGGKALPPSRGRKGNGSNNGRGKGNDNNNNNRGNGKGRGNGNGFGNFPFQFAIAGRRQLRDTLLRIRR